MKKRFMFFAALCVVCSALGAQVFYEGQGGKGLTVRIGEIVAKGLSSDDVELPSRIQMTLSGDFRNYAGMTVPDLEDTAYSAQYTLTGTITKINELYELYFTIKDNSSGTTKTSYGPMQHTREELNTLKGIKAASEELIARMGVTLTQAEKTALRTTTSKDVEVMNAMVKSLLAPTEFERRYYTYQASNLDPTSAEAARRVAAYQAEIYKAPEINLAMPDIRIPEIRAPEFKAPEIRMVATGNIGADARERRAQFEAQREVSRLRQESGDKAMKDLQDAFLAQFREQSDAVKKQQADLQAQRDILLAQQKTLLERQRQTIAQLRETENSYDIFFTEHPPFEIIFEPEVKQVGSDNLEKGTIDMRFQIASVGTAAMQVIPLMLADFEKGLGVIEQGLKDINAEFDKIEPLLAQVETAGRNALTQLVTDYAAQMAVIEAAEKDYAAQLAKLDMALKTTGYAQLGVDYAVRPDTGYAERLAKQYAVQPAGYDAAKYKTMGDTWTLAKWNKDESRTFVIEARLENEEGKTIGTAEVELTNMIYAVAYTHPLHDTAFCVFHDVPVNDITTTLKVTIQQVNGIDVTAAANADYIKISPLEADGYTKDGWDIAGFGKNGRNQMGLTRLEEEKPAKDAENAAKKAAKKAARQARIQKMWGNGHFGVFIGGAVNIEPSGGLFEVGLEGGGKWFVIDASLGWGGGSLTVDDEMVEKKLELGSDDWSRARVFSPRIGAAIPITFGRARINIGGGIEFLNINVSDHKEKEGRKTSKTLDTLVTPYVGARLDIPLGGPPAYGRFVIGYRGEFPPADKFETYFGKPVSMRHTIFTGFVVGGVYGGGR